MKCELCGKELTDCEEELCSYCESLLEEEDEEGDYDVGG